MPVTTTATTERNPRIDADRTLCLEGVHNARHLGGHPTASGQPTIAADLVRSGSLHELTPAGMDALRDRGVRAVVDFRSAVERDLHPTPDLSGHGITVVGAPVFENDALPDSLAQRDRYPGHAAIYRDFLTMGGEAWRALCETIAASEGGVLFHCSVGKDRTGVAAALLLELAGAPDDRIVADYARSAEELAPVVEERAASFQKRGISPHIGRLMMDAPPEAMEATLEFLRGRWGSAAGYLGALGLGADTVAAVRARMLGG